MLSHVSLVHLVDVISTRSTWPGKYSQSSLAHHLFRLLDIPTSTLLFLLGHFSPASALHNTILSIFIKIFFFSYFFFFFFSVLEFTFFCDLSFPGYKKLFVSFHFLRPLFPSSLAFHFSLSLSLSLSLFLSIYIYIYD